MQMEGRGDNHHSWDRIPLFLAKNNLCELWKDLLQSITKQEI